MSSQNNVASISSEAVLMNKLSEPETIEQLISLLDKLEKFNVLLESFEQFISRSPEMADSVNRLIISLREELPKNHFINNLQKSLETLKRLQEFFNSEEFKQLEAVLFHEKTLKLVSKVSRSITEAISETETKGSESTSIFVLMKELTNPEIQPAINFVLKFAKILSRELNNA